MKTVKLPLFVLLISAMAFMTSCKKDKNVYAEDFSVTIAENPADGDELGTIQAKTEKSYLTYTLLSESVEGALAIDAVTGMLSVKDKSIFNYEYNPVITAKVEASNGKHDAVSNVTITLTDVYEEPAVLGSFRDGGVVFWVDPIDNSKGMVCSVNDIVTSSADWGCHFEILSGANGLAIGTGAQNTKDIMEECSSTTSAAYICGNLVLNTFSDWFLPSRDEMIEIYTNKAMVNATSTANNGTILSEDVLYWSSSQSTYDKAYDFYFNNGNTEPTLKLNVFSVRAVRVF